MKFILKQISVLLVIILVSSTLYSQKKTKVNLKSANSIRSDKSINNGARRLIGDVVFEQDSTIMECDSAYFYAEKNMFDAFGNVHLYKLGNESVDVKSDFLRHNGDLKMAYFRNNVVLRDKQIILYTDSLDYDIANDIGYYIYGGKLVDSATTLTSVKGHYYNKQNNVFFKNNVVVTHNEGEYKMYTDTLKYNTESEIVYFFGPTEFFNDTNYMYAKFGWYNTQTDVMFMRNDAYYSNTQQIVEADSLIYKRNDRLGYAYSNVTVNDTVQDMIAKGNYIEVRQYNNSLFITDSAQVISILDGDSVYMHADTLYTAVDSIVQQFTKVVKTDTLLYADTVYVSLNGKMPGDSLLVRDSIVLRDSTVVFDSVVGYRYFTAYYHVKIFKSNFQAKTDSLHMSLEDSIMQFHGSPVLWAEGSQITGEYIEAFVKNEKIDRFKIYNTGLVISEHDSVHFNQIKGKEITGYFKNDELHRVDVQKLSETIYFPEDEGEIIGVNMANSDNITIYMKESEPSRIVYRSKPVSNTYPLEDKTEKEMRLKGFTWQKEIRPLRPSDIFLWDSNTFPLPNITDKK